MFVINQCEAFHNVAKQHIINEVTSLAERHHVPEGNASLKNDKFLSKLVVFLAGVAGFEPTNAADKVLCLTA